MRSDDLNLIANYEHALGIAREIPEMEGLPAFWFGRQTRADQRTVLRYIEKKRQAAADMARMMEAEKARGATMKRGRPRSFDFGILFCRMRADQYEREADASEAPPRSVTSSPRPASGVGALSLTPSLSCSDLMTFILLLILAFFLGFALATVLVVDAFNEDKKRASDSLDEAWGVIANVDEGEWRQNDEWVDAAWRWRRNQPRMNWKHQARRWLAVGAHRHRQDDAATRRTEEGRVRWLFFYDDFDRQFAQRSGIRPCFTKQDILRELKRSGKVVFCPERMFPARRSEGFVWFAAFVWSLAQNLHGVKVFGADEIQSLVPVGINLGKGMNGLSFEPVKAILEMGRRHEIDTFFCSLSPNRVNDTIRSMTTHGFAFQMTDPLALKWAKAWWPGEDLPRSRRGITRCPTPTAWSAAGARCPGRRRGEVKKTGIWKVSMLASIWTTFGLPTLRPATA
jgi:hypothetical protein